MKHSIISSPFALPIYEDSSFFWKKTAALVDSVFDKRRIVVSFYEYPYVTNCYLESIFEELGSCRGTATLISPLLFDYSWTLFAS